MSLQVVLTTVLNVCIDRTGTENFIVYVSWDSGIIWREPVPTHAISVFDVDGSGESSENCKVV